MEPKTHNGESLEKGYRDSGQILVVYGDHIPK
jgi:hypothetical protein